MECLKTFLSDVYNRVVAINQCIRQVNFNNTNLRFCVHSIHTDDVWTWIWICFVVTVFPGFSFSNFSPIDIIPCIIVYCVNIFFCYITIMIVITLIVYIVGMCVFAQHAFSTREMFCVFVSTNKFSTLNVICFDCFKQINLIVSIFTLMRAPKYTLQHLNDAASIWQSNVEIFFCFHAFILFVLCFERDWLSNTITEIFYLISAISIWMKAIKFITIFEKWFYCVHFDLFLSFSHFMLCTPSKFRFLASDLTLWVFVGFFPRFFLILYYASYMLKSYLFKLLEIIDCYMHASPNLI